MKVCLGISGSIAAYRSPDLVKELVRLGHSVQVVLTESAEKLVSPRVLSTFSKNPVYPSDPFAAGYEETDHIRTSRWADCIVVYGATAHFLARYAQGLANDFLTLQLLASRSPVILAPAMNPAMWEHPAVQQNIAILKQRGVHFVDPIHGKVACGEVGVGHIADISTIVEKINLLNFSTPSETQPLFGKKVLLSVGPMKTAIDSVRYLQNRSSGQMGLEVAKAASHFGAEVTILLGPVDSNMREQFSDFSVHRYESPLDYGRSLDKLFPQCDIYFSLAAVLDFEFISQPKKIDRESLEKSLTLNLPIQPVPDFVARMAQRKKPHQKVIAFAAEDGDPEEILKRAERKMKKKGADAIIANPVRSGAGPESQDNEFWILRPDQPTVHLELQPKSLLGSALIKELF